jgi:hypothetical protein
VKFAQQSSLLTHWAPVPPQHVVSLLLAFDAVVQYLFVSFVQHCLLVVQSDPSGSGLHFGHFFFFFFLFFFLASASPAKPVSPTAATADAAAALSAELSVLRRVLVSPTRRVSESNLDLSTTSSDLGDALAPPVSTERRPSGLQRPAHPLRSLALFPPFRSAFARDTPVRWCECREWRSKRQSSWERKWRQFGNTR